MIARRCDELRGGSDSCVKQPALLSASHQHKYRRDSSTPSQQARGQRLSFFLPLTIGEGAERRDGAGHLGHLGEGAPPALAGRRALPALHVAIFCDGTAQDGPAIRDGVAAALHPASSATKGGPLLGGGRCRRTLGRWLRSPRLQCATPCSAKQTSHDDALNEQGDSADTPESQNRKPKIRRAPTS